MNIDIPENTEFYKQEGDMIPFAFLPWVYRVNDFDERYFDEDFGHLYGFIQEDYARAYWDVDRFNEVAKDVYDKFGENKSIDKIYKEYLQFTQEIEKIYKQYRKDDILSFSEDKLQSFFDELRSQYREFWKLSLFIDAFDAGFDAEKIGQIKDEFGFSDEEIEALTTPRKLTYKSRRKLELLKILKLYQNQSEYENVEEFLEQSERVKEYINNFDYHKSSYAEIKHITKEEITDEAKKFIENPEMLENTYKKLRNQTKEQKKKEKDVLQKHDLQHNPLYFFQKLSYWREHRKKINLMGIHLLNYILFSLEKKTQIDRKYLSYLLYDEVDDALSDNISSDKLVKRFEQGWFIASTEEGVRTVSGNEANKLLKIFEEISADNEEKTSAIDGVAASSGTGEGKVRVVMSADKFDDFKHGEVLVTGMTRPEFVPIMKKASAIVTNEGGITSHAAIVSRELGIPCVIGTQNATQVLEGGDEVEVNAEEGTVRVLDKNNEQ